jgi:uncharacterized protein (TIGR02145 family)
MPKESTMRTALLLALLCAALHSRAQRVTNVTAEQQGQELLIHYHLEADGPVEVQLYLSTDRGSRWEGPLKNCSGDVGMKVMHSDSFIDSLLDEAYERTQTEIKASHILVALSPIEKDTLQAWNRIQELRKRIELGENFGNVASSEGGSDDSNTRKKNGMIGWFNALQMVYPFENAAYKTPIGSIAGPIRTTFGYHLLFIHEKRPGRGIMTAKHILLRFRNNSTENLMTKERINKIYEEINKGLISFENAAIKYSEDTLTASNEGLLPSIETGRFIEEFEDAAFRTEFDGQITEPFETPYGWHIIKRVNLKPNPSKDEIREILVDRILRDSRSKKRKSSTKTISWDVLKSRELVGDGIVFKVVASVMKNWLNQALTYGSVTDIDGNTYATIQIGTQVWMAENLRTTRYRNGDPIPNVTEAEMWGNLSSGAWCHYENDKSYEVPYGKLYNWYTVVDARKVCPAGWHVPSDVEWDLLGTVVGQDGGQLKNTTGQFWTKPNTDARNSSGLSGLASGIRYHKDGGFFGLLGFALWWSATDWNSEVAWFRMLSSTNKDIARDAENKRSGFSVRCLRD